MVNYLFIKQNNNGDTMKIRLGYACLTKTLDQVTSSSSLSYTNYNKIENKEEKLHQTILSNLNDLEKIIDYNIANHIHFYRLSSKLIPLATHKDVTFDYIHPYQSYYERIGKKIHENHMRVDFHPDQFCVLNSVKKEVVENSFRILEYHYQLLNAFNIQNKIIILHVGSNVFGKEKSIQRFIHNFQKLPSYLQECIAIENDDKVFNIMDCLEISHKIHVPIVLDVHHHKCNHGEINLLDHIEEIFQTWKKIHPKIHFSSPKNKTKKEMRSHHDYIDSDSFINFLKDIKKIPYDIDVMVEAKAKDEAVFKLIRELKYKTYFNFIDETTFLNEN